MQEKKYWKPNMNNLKGKKGRAILEELRNMKPASTAQLEKEAEEYMKQILAKRKQDDVTGN